MAQQTQSKGHKKYGAKLANPRIRASKEHRNCGPLGYYVRAVGHTFTSRADWLARGGKG